MHEVQVLLGLYLPSDLGVVGHGGSDACLFLHLPPCPSPQANLVSVVLVDLVSRHLRLHSSLTTPPPHLTLGSNVITYCHNILLIELFAKCLPSQNKMGTIYISIK